jgi:hypothetical protein
VSNVLRWRLGGRPPQSPSAQLIRNQRLRKEFTPELRAREERLLAEIERQRR